MSQTPSTENAEPKQLKGLYKNVTISVKTLNIVTLVCVVAIILLVAMALQTPGLTVTFDSMGGTDVASQKQMYGELLVLPQPPTREGYTFTGWYKDYACYEPWDVAADTIQSELTLYAGWEKIE